MKNGPIYSVKGLSNWVLDFAEARGVSLSNMALNKLVYFIVESVLLDRDRLLTTAKIEAWEHGPVFREIYFEFKQFGNGPISSRALRYDPVSNTKVEAKEEFATEDVLLFTAILSQLINKTASQLRDMSHAPYGPWYRVWWHGGESNPGMEISPEIIKSSFGREV